MCVALAILASQSSPACGWILTRSDRAAAAWAAAASTAPVAYCPAGDLLAAEYAAAENCVVVPTTDAVESLRFDLAWIGGGFLEQFGDDFAARLAERRSATLLFDVLSCTTAVDGRKLVIRDAGRGARDVIHVTGPAVLVVSPSVPRTGYVSRFRRQQARKELAGSYSNAESVVAPEENWQPVRPRTRRISKTDGTASLEERMDSAFGMTTANDQPSDGPIVADPQTCAEHLLRYLAHHGFLRRLPAIERELAVSDGRGIPQSSVGSSVEKMEVCQPLRQTDSAATRRPRSTHDSPARRLRQPRLMDFAGVARASVPADRGPRLVGTQRQHRRGPRLKVDPSEIT